MSHFSVAVFHKPDQSVESLLEAFDTENNLESHIEYTKQEAIDYVRNNYPESKDWTEEQCWEYLAEDYDSDGKGNLISLCNPQAHLDDWEIGGRWEGMLKVKGKKVNSGLVKDITFTENKKAYNFACYIWDVAVKGKAQDPKKPIFDCPTKKELLKVYGNRETYAKSRAAFTTFAVVTPDGEWQEKGIMGWFGMSSDTLEEERDWTDNYKKRFIDTADPEWMLTIVDCHI